MRLCVAAQIELTMEEVSRLERLGDEAGVRTLREWEKEMAISGLAPMPPCCPAFPLAIGRWSRPEPW